METPKTPINEMLGVVSGIARNFTEPDPALFEALRKTAAKERFKELDGWGHWSTVLDLLAGSIYAASKQLAAENPEQGAQFRAAAPAACSLKIAEFMARAALRDQKRAEETGEGATKQ